MTKSPQSDVSPEWVRGGLLPAVQAAFSRPGAPTFSLDGEPVPLSAVTDSIARAACVAAIRRVAAARLGLPPGIPAEDVDLMGEAGPGVAETCDLLAAVEAEYGVRLPGLWARPARWALTLGDIADAVLHRLHEEAVSIEAARAAGRAA